MSQTLMRLSVLAGLICLCVNAWAQGIIRLTSYPNMTVADGRSTTTISAEIRDRQGRLVPDGTQVVFTTNRGSFSDPVVKTTNGIARAIFSAGSVPGTANIQASALTINAVATLEVELVSDRSLLSTAKEYIEVVAPNYLMYSVDQRILGAAGPDKGVSLRYREVEIDADDLQVTVPTYEVRARKARLKFGDVEHEFEELYFQLDKRKGFGITTLMVPDYSMVGDGKLFRFEKSMKERKGVASVGRSGVTAATEQAPPNAFVFSDLLESNSTVSAKKAVAFPKGQIQFQRAEMYVGTQRVMKLPLFQLNMYGGTPLINEQVVNVYNNQLSVNYPHYLSLKPGETSLLRFRTGERYGRATSGLGGFFLDYELNWNRGDDMDGGLSVTGLTRSDWSVGARQYLRLDNRTVATAVLDFPSHQSLYGSATLNRQFDGFQLNLTANNSRDLRGDRFKSQQYYAVLEKDPTKVGNLPLRLFYGLSANYNNSVTVSRFTTPSGPQTTRTELQQQATSLRSRLQLLPLQLDRDTTLTGSLLLSKQYGTNVQSDFSTLADLSMSRRLGGNASVMMQYNYARDGYTSKLTGMHSLNLQAFYDGGRTSFAATLNRSLDIDRFSYFVDASYRLSGLWRMSYSLTLDQYLGAQFRDDLMMLSYRLGAREIGVTYSVREKRVGFQVFGAPLN
jgi:hypothetical protein